MNGSNRVLMIGWEYPPHNSGGLGVACQGVTEALASQNVQIYFTLPFSFSGSVSHMDVMGCADSALKNNQYPPFDPYHPQVQKIGNDEVDAFDLSSLHRGDMEQRVEAYAHDVVQKATKVKNDFDVVHAHDWMSFPAATKIKQKLGKPVVAHVHSTEYDRVPSGSGSSFISQIENKGLKMADQVIAVSAYTKHLLVNKYAVNANKIHVVHNGIDQIKQENSIKTNQFAKKRPVVVFMGRLTMQKGVDHFLRLAASVLETMPDVLFVVAGSGHLYQELLFQTAGQRLSASVLFSGFVRDKQRNKLLDRADVFVMPSISEPFGLVALEAAQRHTPVIVSKNAGVSEVMSSAVVIDFWDIDKMTNGITKLLNDKGFHQEVTQNQLNDLKMADWNIAAKKIRGVYRQAFIGKTRHIV